MIPYKQLPLADIYSNCQDKFENDKPAFLSLLETHIDIDEFITIFSEIISMHQLAEPVNILYNLRSRKIIPRDGIIFRERKLS